MSTTVNKKRISVMGSKRCVMADITTSTSSDTFATGLHIIEGFSADAGSAAVTSATKSGGTITVGSSSGVTNCQVIAWGY